MNRGDLNKVWEIRALKRKPAEDEARKILEKIAKQVQPIMRKRNWRVKLLSEFCPKNPSLLGLNVGGGVHVKLRLRRHNADLEFFPFHQVLDTMLHELCHNVLGPHNASFYKLWDELRKECEDLMNNGITGTGEGFDVPGRRLGGFSRQPPLSSLRQTALAAAERRARLGSLLPSGPRRLGGDSSIMGALTPVQAAAMAAERRIQDNIWCGSEFCDGSGEGEAENDFLEESVHVEHAVNAFNKSSSDVISRKRSFQSNNDSSLQSSTSHTDSNIVDLTTKTSTYGSLSNHNANSGKKSRFYDNLISEVFDNHQNATINAASTAGSLLQHETHDTEDAAMWQCVACTLLNPPLAPICELCSTHKPNDVKDKYKLWSCKFCTLENSVKLEKCAACGQWRYSHGPPVSTPPI